MSISRWLAGGAVLVALITALTIALWPQSEADKARADGENLGSAVAQLRDAETTDDVHDALDDLGDAVHDTRSHASDAVYEQAQSQGDAVYHAVNGFIGTVSAEDDWDQELYEEELDQAVEDLSANAEELRTNAPEVEAAYWEGVQDGLSS